MIPGLLKVALTASGSSHQFVDGTEQVGSPSFDEVLQGAFQASAVPEVSDSAQAELEVDASGSAELGESEGHETLAEDGIEVEHDALSDLQSGVEAGRDTDAPAQDFWESIPTAIAEKGDEVVFVSDVEAEQSPVRLVEVSGETETDQPLLGGLEAPRKVSFSEAGGEGYQPKEPPTLERPASAPTQASLGDAILGRNSQASSLDQSSTESSALVGVRQPAEPEHDSVSRESRGETLGEAPSARAEAKWKAEREVGQGFEPRTGFSKTAQAREEISEAKGSGAAILQSKIESETRAPVTPRSATVEQSVQTQTTASIEDPQKVALAASFQTNENSAGRVHLRSDDVATETQQISQENSISPVGLTASPLPASPITPANTAAAHKISLTLPQVAEVVEVGIRSEMNGEIEIELRPLDLGRMKLVFKQDAQGLSITVDAENPETVEQIKRHLEGLSAEARANPDTAPRFRFEGGSFGQNAREGQSSQRQTRGAPSRGYADDSPEASSINTPQIISELVSGNLDIRA